MDPEFAQVLPEVVVDLAAAYSGGTAAASLPLPPGTVNAFVKVWADPQILFPRLVRCLLDVGPMSAGLSIDLSFVGVSNNRLQVLRAVGGSERVPSRVYAVPAGGFLYLQLTPPGAGADIVLPSPGDVLRVIPGMPIGTTLAASAAAATNRVANVLKPFLLGAGP